MNSSGAALRADIYETDVEQSDDYETGLVVSDGYGTDDDDMDEEEDDGTNENVPSEIEQIMAAYHAGDSYAMVDMYNKLFGYIIHMIKKKCSYALGDDINSSDIVSMCKLHVLEAMKSYDPGKGSLTTYFTFVIQHAITRYKNERLNNSSPHYSARANKVRSGQKRLESAGITPTLAALSIETGLPVKQVEEALAIINGAEERGFESSDMFDAAIGPKVESTENAYFKISETEFWQSELDKMDQQGVEMFMRFHGIGCFPESYTKIAEEFSERLGKTVSVKTVEQTINRVRKSLYMNPNIRKQYGIKTGYRGKDSVIGVSVMTPEHDIELAMNEFDNDDDNEEFDVF